MQSERRYRTGGSRPAFRPRWRAAVVGSTGEYRAVRARIHDGSWIAAQMVVLSCADLAGHSDGPRYEADRIMITTVGAADRQTVVAVQTSLAIMARRSISGTADGTFCGFIEAPVELSIGQRTLGVDRLPTTGSH